MRANLRSTYPGDWAFLLGPMLVAAAPFQGWIEPNTVGILKDDGDLGVNDDDDADSIETEGSVDDADSVDGVNGPTATGSATATAAPVTLSRISETKTRTVSAQVYKMGIIY